MPECVAIGRAARELGLKQRECELAVRLGELRAQAGPGPGRPRVPGTEVDRLAADPAAVAELRGRIRLVGSAAGAELLDVSPGRFVRLARGGFLSPVRFTVNRYRAVVWLYLAHELRAFAEVRPELLSGRHPRQLRETLGAGADLRPRHWRARRTRELVVLADGPWERAAARAAVLAGPELGRAVPDPDERNRLRELRPRLDTLWSDSPVVRRIAAGLGQAAGEDEIGWCRLQLAAELAEARAEEREDVAAPPGTRPARRRRTLRARARHRQAGGRCPGGPDHRRPTSVTFSTARPSSSDAARSTSADRPQS